MRVISIRMDWNVSTATTLMNPPNVAYARMTTAEMIIPHTGSSPKVWKMVLPAPANWAPT